MTAGFVHRRRRGVKPAARREAGGALRRLPGAEQTRDHARRGKARVLHRPLRRTAELLRLPIGRARRLARLGRPGTDRRKRLLPGEHTLGARDEAARLAQRAAGHDRASALRARMRAGVAARRVDRRADGVGNDPQAPAAGGRSGRLVRRPEAAVGLNDQIAGPRLGGIAILLDGRLAHRAVQCPRVVRGASVTEVAAHLAGSASTQPDGDIDLRSRSALTPRDGLRSMRVNSASNVGSWAQSLILAH
jgi:hypothetical protein